MRLIFKNVERETDDPARIPGNWKGGRIRGKWTLYRRKKAKSRRKRWKK